MIALLDYGSGNLRSVHKSLLKVGANVRLVQRPEEIGDARALVLPGVGAFDDCIHALRQQELLEAAKAFIDTGKPFLGICVGYQALFERSEEFNSCAAGLGVFRGSVIRFADKNGLKIPQIGWNQLEIERPDCPLYRGIASGSYVYFVHSFYPQPAGFRHRRHAHRIRRPLRVLRLARQCLCHAIPSGKEPEGRLAIAEEFCGFDLANVFKLRPERGSATRSNSARQRACELRDAVLDCGHCCGSLSRAPSKQMQFRTLFKSGIIQRKRSLDKCPFRGHDVRVHRPLRK